MPDPRLIILAVTGIVWAIEHVVDFLRNRLLFPSGEAHQVFSWVLDERLMDETDHRMIDESRKLLFEHLGETPVKNLNTLNAQDRMTALENVLQDLVKLYDLDLKGVQFADLGMGHAGAYVPDERIIYINVRILLCDDEEALETLLLTIFHELRHAVQNYIIEKPEGVWNKSEAQARAFANNMTGNNYIRHDVDPEGYHSQLVEVDADTFAVLIVHNDGK